MKLPFCLTCVVLATVACSDRGTEHPPGGGASALGAVVRDSADVRIVENPRRPAGSRLGWRVGAKLAVSISTPSATVGPVEGKFPLLFILII